MAVDFPELWIFRRETTDFTKNGGFSGLWIFHGETTGLWKIVDFPPPNPQPETTEIVHLNGQIKIPVNWKVRPMQTGKQKTRQTTFTTN
ncbi:MAG: hypothetical protein J5912_02275 [Clostridia bacterium]|nr:hypothetical protein [Clostridia bacterium]